MARFVGFNMIQSYINPIYVYIYIHIFAGSFAVLNIEILELGQLQSREGSGGVAVYCVILAIHEWPLGLPWDDRLTLLSFDGISPGYPGIPV